MVFDNLPLGGDVSLYLVSVAIAVASVGVLMCVYEV